MFNSFVKSTNQSINKQKFNQEFSGEKNVLHVKQTLHKIVSG